MQYAVVRWNVPSYHRHLLLSWWSFSVLMEAAGFSETGKFLPYCSPWDRTLSPHCFFSYCHNTRNITSCVTDWVVSIIWLLLSPFYWCRYFFKTECDDLDMRVIQEEITDDNEILPLWEGKIMAQVKPVEWRKNKLVIVNRQVRNVCLFSIFFSSHKNVRVP